MPTHCWRKIKRIIMKKTALFIISIVCSAMSVAQQCNIPLQIVFAEEADAMPQQAQNIITNKLLSVITSEGIAGTENNTQFALVPRYDVIEKHVTPGPPAKVIYNLNITLNIADLQSGKIFTSYTFETDGVGNNENTAFIDGMKRINSKKEMKSFLKSGHDKIIDYYNQNYQSIIKKANTLAGMKNYEEALYMTMAIPECCNGYNAAIKASLDIFQKYTDFSCSLYLSKARQMWVSGQNAEAASEAMEFLSRIYPDAACYGEATALYKEIKAKVNADWNFEMKHYNDAVSLEKQRIQAMRDIGVAYGRGQKAKTTNLLFRK